MVTKRPNEDETPFNPSRKHKGEAQSNLAHQSDRCSVALLLVDVINNLDFEGNEHILKEAKSVGPKIADLRQRCKERKIPVIFAQDNQGKWKSDFGRLRKMARDSGGIGRELCDLLGPDEEDYNLIKPKHSAFYGSSLSTLLQHLGVRTLIITGFAGEVCVLFSANDAYMEDLAVIVPSDTMGCTSPEGRKSAEHLLESVLHIKPTISTDLDLDKLLAAHDSGPGSPLESET